VPLPDNAKTELTLSLFTVKLDSPCYDLAARGKYLFVVTTNCQARVYNVTSALAVVSPCSIAHLVEPDILDIDVRTNGTPIVITTDSSAYAYDTRLQSWVPICDKEHLGHDTPSAGRVNGPLADIEQKCRSSMRNVANGNAKNAEPEWWDETQQMGILDMRIRASVLLGSKDEYRYSLLQYATFLGEQEFTGRAEELLKDLIGPVYRSGSQLCPLVRWLIFSHPGKENTWDPDVLGYNKRELAMTVTTSLCTFPAKRDELR
jgi:protein HIRA/HIR1